MHLLLFRICNYSKPSLSMGIMFLKKPWTMKMQSAKLQLYGKKWGQQNHRHINSWSINTKKFVWVFTNYLFMAEHCLGDQTTHSTWWRRGEGKTEDLVFQCSAFCMFLHTYLYGAITTSISCCSLGHLPTRLSTSNKQIITSSTTWKLFFTATVVSWGLSETGSEDPHLLVPRVLSDVQSPSLLFQQHKLSKTSWISASSKSKKSGTTWANTTMLLILSCWLQNPQKVNICFSPKLLPSSHSQLWSSACP